MDGRCNTISLLQPKNKFLDGGSHTRVSFPVSELECYGCYSITGPAVIKKSGDSLEAFLLAEAQVEFFDRDSVVSFPGASIAESEGQTMTPCRLYGEHVELSGNYVADTQHGKHYHDGKLVLSVHSLDENTTIVLQAGGRLSHPINVQPPASSTQ